MFCAKMFYNTPTLILAESSQRDCSACRTLVPREVDHGHDPVGRQNELHGGEDLADEHRSKFQRPLLHNSPFIYPPPFW